jgi:uncharacterized cupin superfamily protein
MERKPAKIIRGDEAERDGTWFAQRLNPRSQFRGSALARKAGLERVGVSLARLPPGKESFALHAHQLEEEWIYILEGTPTLLLEHEKIPLAPGDFVGFPAPQEAHNLANETETEVVYLMGGEAGKPIDIIDYPSLGARYLLERVPGSLPRFHRLGEGERPFGPAIT